MAVLSHCLAQAKRLSLLAVLSVFCLGLTLPAKAICPNATTFGNGFERRLKEEQPTPGEDACTGVWLVMDGEGRIGLFVANDPLNKLDPDGLDTWVPYPPPGHYVSDPQPQPQYPEGFAMCQRDVAVEGPSDIVAQCCNSFGGQHTYLQYVSTPQPPAQGPPFVWGWGFSGGTRTAPELHFDPSFCKPCTKNGSALKYGSGMGKSSKDASDTEIRDCIMNRKPTRPYSFPRYVCSDWAKEAASDCGLTCR
jgi:hypothetical protein